MLFSLVQNINDKEKEEPITSFLVRRQNAVSSD